MDEIVTKFDGTTPTDNIFWMAIYDDGSYDIEEKPSNFPKIKFDKLHHFTMFPKGNLGYNTAICIIKPKEYRLIWRKQRNVKTSGEYLGSDYLLGLDPDDNSELIKKIEAGYEDPYYSPMKKDPRGFRIWLTKEGQIRAAGAFKRTDRIEDVEIMGIKRKIRYITCEII